MDELEHRTPPPSGRGLGGGCSDALEQWLAEAGLEVAVIYDGPPHSCPLCRDARERQEAA